MNLFVDLDGVLADFEAKIFEITGKTSDELGHKIWPRIQDMVITSTDVHAKLINQLGKIGSGSAVDLGFFNKQGTKPLNWLVINKIVDLDRGMYRLTPYGSDINAALDSTGEFRSGPDFYNSLDMLPDGMVLWNHIKPMNPIILTGKPMGNWAEKQKRTWCARHLGDTVPVIVCLAREKAEMAAAWMKSPTLNGAVLIDDREKARAPWVDLGGRFILHTSASNSIAQLKNL